MPHRLPRAQGDIGVLAILAAASFASTYSGRIADPLVGIIARDLASTPETIALMTALFALPYAFIQPILGPVGDSLGKARVVKICLAVLALSLAASTLANDAAILLALRTVSGAAAGGIIPAALATIGDRIELERRQVAISRLIMAVVLGQLCGASISGILADLIGWRGVFAVAGAVALLAWIAVIAGLGTPPTARSRLSMSSAIERYRAILVLGRARALYAFVFIEAIAIYGVFPFIAPVFEQRGLGGSLEAGLVLAAFGVGGLVFSLAVSLMIRLGLTRLLIGGGIVVALALAMLGLATDWRLALVAMLISGFGFYMLHNPFQTLVTEVAPSSRASAVSLHAFSFFGGQAIGVVVIGAGLASIGFTPTMALCAVAVLALGFVASALLGRRPAD